MKIDLHCYSKYSHDTYLEPEMIVEKAVLKGLDGICFTEHHFPKSLLSVEQLQVPDGFVILRGVEISTDAGHLLVCGLKDDSWNMWSRNHYLALSEVVRRVHLLGGIFVPAHPFRG